MSQIERISDGRGSFAATLQGTPTWLIVPFMLLIIAYASMSLILPDVTKRSWHVPSPNDLVSAYGHFVGYRLDTRSPYHFVENGGADLYLTCDPWATKWNDCLAHAGLDYNQLTGKLLSLTYYKAPVLFGVRNIIIGLSGSAILNNQFQERSLAISARLQDQGDLVGLLFGIPIIVFALWVIASKLIWYRS